MGLAPMPQASWDRARLTDALERLLVSGEPRHVDHDEGQDLQEALTAALAAGGDPELPWLATRAALPIVVRVIRPLFAATDQGSLEIRAARVLTLPWPVSYTASVEVRVERDVWRRIARVASTGSATERLDRFLPPAWLAPGLHDIELRARIQYTYAGMPFGLPHEELRPLPSVHYGVWSAAREPELIAGFVDRARAVPVARLDAGLPQVPLEHWLMQLPFGEPGVPPYWHTDWCAFARHPSGEGAAVEDICAVAMFQWRDAVVLDAWIKVGTVRTDAAAARWIEAEPTFEAAFLRRGARAPIRLPRLATLIDAPQHTWPTPALVVRPSDIAIDSRVPVPNRPTTLRAIVTNTGAADAYGVTIDVLAGSGEEPALHRRFVRDVQAGQTAAVTAPVRFPERYAWIMVRTMWLTDHAEWTVTEESAPDDRVAVRIINAAAAPAGFVKRMCGHVAGRGQCSTK